MVSFNQRKIMSLAEDLQTQAASVASMAPAPVLTILNDSVQIVASSGLAGRAVGVGDKAPDFDLPGPNGARVRLADLLFDGPVVVSFYRGGWCPYCNLELRALQAALPEITGLGATLVAISPESPDSSLSTAEKDELTFSVLSDAGSATSRTYGLVYSVDAAMREVLVGFGNDLTKINGTDSWELPIPATYVIGTDGTIAYAFADADYRRRSEPADVVAALRTIAVS